MAIYITLFRFITILCGTANIVQNISLAVPQHIVTDLNNVMYIISTNFLKSKNIHMFLILLGFELYSKHEDIQMI